MSWTIAELARTLVARGDPAAARATLDDPLARSAEAEPGSATALLVAESAVAVAEGDREAGLAKALAAIEAEDGDRRLPNPYAAQVWWTGSLFGPAEAGGGDAVERGSRDLGAQWMAPGTPGTRAPSPERLTARGWLHPAGGSRQSVPTGAAILPSRRPGADRKRMTRANRSFPVGLRILVAGLAMLALTLNVPALAAGAPSGGQVTDAKKAYDAALAKLSEHPLPGRGDPEPAERRRPEGRRPATARRPGRPRRCSRPSSGSTRRARSTRRSVRG